MSPISQETTSGPVEVGAPLLVPFGKYVLVRKIAEGGMAEIFLAKQVGVDGFEKNVVIKRMLASLTEESEFVEMFREEAHLAAQLSHPNVVQILELGLELGSYFIAMEYIAGEDLSMARRRSARLKVATPIPVIARIIADAARGLHHAHELTDERGAPLGLVHRDISPSNVFISYSGQVKVLDFGIARATTRASRTAVGTVKGKAHYMSAEQASAKPIDRRSDIYSIGVSCYEALTARRPFARDTELAVLQAVVTNDYAPIHEVRPDVPEALAEIVRKAMALRPEDRYQTGEELAAALDAFLATETRPPSSSDVGLYIKEVSGEERVLERTRIPSLKELRVLAGHPSAPVPGAGRALAAPSPLPLRMPIADANDPAKAPKTSDDLPPSTTRAPWLVGIAAALALAAAGAWRLFQPGPAPTPVQVTAAVATADAGPAVAAVVPIAPVKPPEVPLEPEHPTPTPDAGAPSAVGPRPAPPKPVVLNGALFSAVMRKRGGPVIQCFVLHRASLPTESGSVPVTITVASSGRVTAVSSPLGDSAAGKCVEAQARAIPFPPHVAKEATFAIPFAWKAKE